MDAHLPQYESQSAGPLYPQVLYNRPVTRHAAGRLLVAGGHAGELSQPTAFNQLALAAGVGECRVLVPDSLAKLIGGLPGVYFAASTDSGSLAREALGRILELSEDADAVALGASLSNNSNTAMLIERLVTQIERPLIVFGDALVALRHHTSALTDRPDTLVVCTMAEVFKLCGALDIPIHVRQGGGLLNKLEIIQNLTAVGHATYAVFGTEVVVAAEGQLTVTPVDYRLATTPAVFPAVLGTFWIQNRRAPLAGLTTGAYVIRQARAAVSESMQPTVGQLATAIDQLLRATDEF